MKKILIVIFSLLLIVTGCKENKLPQNNETIVWRLMYDINTIPKLDLSFEDTNLMKKVNANTTKKKEDSDFELNSKPDDYNVDSIKEITCKKYFNTEAQLKPFQVDNGLLVLAALPDKKVSLIKFNMTGKVVWEKDIGVSGGNITEITELNNGNIVFGVSAAYSWNEKSLGQGYVFCYSKTGEQIWKYSYEDNIEGRIKYIFQDKAGNLLCSGNVNNGNSNYYTTDVVITKLSINGEFITEAFFGGKENELLEGSAYSESTGLIISGRTYSDDGELTDSEKDSPVDCIASINESLSLNWVYNPEKTLNYQLDKLQVEEGLIAIPGINVPQTQEEVKSGYETAYYHLILNNKGKIAHEIKIDNIASLSEVTACLTRGQNPVYVHKFIEGSKIIIKNLKGRTIFELISEVTGPERVIPTGDGGFIVIYRYPLRSLPQPLHVSSIWYDTATTLVCYNKSGQLMWQKTYDDYQNNTINDYLYVAY